MKTKPIPFKLTQADEPHVRSLRLLSQSQHDLLVDSENTPRPSYEELIFKHGVPIGTIKSRLYRARQRIIRFRKWANEKAIQDTQKEPARTEGQ